MSLERSPRKKKEKKDRSESVTDSPFPGIACFEESDASIAQRLKKREEPENAKPKPTRTRSLYLRRTIGGSSKHSEPSNDKEVFPGIIVFNEDLKNLDEREKIREQFKIEKAVANWAGGSLNFETINNKKEKRRSLFGKLNTSRV